MRQDISELKRQVNSLMDSDATIHRPVSGYDGTADVALVEHPLQQRPATISITSTHERVADHYDIMDTEDYVEEVMSLENAEKEMIRKALIRSHGKRKVAAQELKISERTLYRKIKEYNQ